MFSFLSAAASGISRVFSEGVRMMATVHPTTSSLVPLLESLEDPAVGQEEKTDAYLTIANRLSGEDGKHFLPAVVKHFSRLGKLFQAHIVSSNVELSQAALQALGFCTFHVTIVAGIPANFMEEILTSLNSIVVKSTDKNTCTRALWVMSKQSFPSDAVARKVPDILKALEAVRAREDLQSVIMDHEALNVVIRLLEQTPGPMGEGAVQWAKLVIPLVVHSASKVRLRAAAALEMGMPLLLQKQQEVAAVIEPLMSSKLIPELQKLFSTKNESNVLKLWPLFVRLLGKLLHRGGPFINSLLHLEELGFRSSSPIIKKIAFIAWKSLIDNFALNPEILCSAKRLKLLMQPLSSIQVRTETLLLTKLEVWWYLVVRLGPNLAVNFEQVGVPLLQIAVSSESMALSVSTPSRNAGQSAALATPKAGGHSFSSSSSTPRLALNSSSSSSGSGQPAFASIQLLGLEMLLHYFLGSEVTPAAAKSKLQLSLEPLTHPLITSPSSFTKHAGVLISAVRDSFIGIGKDAPEALLTLVWKSLIGFVTAAMETGSKKDRPGSEVLTLLLQALESIVSSEALPAQRTLVLLEATVKGIPRKILGSAAYQVANMDVLNGTPALFLILLFHRSGVLPSFVTDERFFLCLETLIGCGLSGTASPLAFSESVLGVMSRNAEAIQNKEHLWRMWSAVVNPLTDTVTQTNEVNQGDALEHNFTAMHHALMFPVTHLVIGHTLPQMTQKSLLSAWSRLYKAFARCSALVATAEENVCCEEFCGKMAAVLDAKALSNPSTLEATACLLLIVIECVDFSPYSPQYQKSKSPHTPLGWVRKKNKALGNLTTFQALLVQVLESFLSEDSPEAPKEPAAAHSGSGPGTALVAILSTLFSNLVLGTAILEALSTLSEPLARLCEHAGRPQNELPKVFTGLGPKLEKLLGEVLGCLQTRSSLAYDDELLALLAPLLRVLFLHRSKQLRTLVTQFWNATFAHAHTLAYPDDLKPVLSQVKQKIPIILPGFQAVDVPEDNSGPYSSESSQIDTRVSGVKIESLGKRDSLLSRAGELREKNSDTPSKPVAVKLDFGSPKLPRRELLEEEASMDFVFIPPETKERVLTEHQKEVKRTKRVDIPVMYNNLDASLDTTVFTQYTQSQEDTMDKPPAKEEPAGTPEVEGQVEVQDEKMETEEAPEPDIKSIQGDMVVEPVADSTGETGKELEPVPIKEMDPKSDDGPPIPDDLGAEETSKETRESSGDDCNVSASSDVVSGTPPKPNSRRLTFITLEKYVEGKAASPVSAMKCTGPLRRVPNSQDASHSQTKDTASPSAPTVSAAVKGTQEIAKCSEQPVSCPLEPDMPEEERKHPHPPVEEVAKRPPSEGTEDEDDVIPDTQAEVDAGMQEVKASVRENLQTKDEDSCADSMYDSCEDSSLNDSQCSQVSSSQSEIRRSGRRRSRPIRPGEDREEVEGRYKLMQKSSIGKGLSPINLPKSDSLPASQTEGQSQGRPGRRCKMAVESQEVEVKERLRMTRADSQTASPQASQNDRQSLGRVTRSRGAGPTEEETNKPKSQTTSSSRISQTNSESQGRSSRRSKVGTSAEDISQTDSQMALSKPVNQTDSQSQERSSRRTKASDFSSEKSQTDSQTVFSVPVSQTDNQSQSRQSSKAEALVPSEETSQTDTQASLSTPVSQPGDQLQERPSRRTKASDASEEIRQINAQASVSTPVSQPDGQSQGRPSRRGKVSEFSEEMSQTDAQASLSAPVSQTDPQKQGRVSRSKAGEPSEAMGPTGAQANLSTPVSQTDGQSQGRPGRRSKVSEISEEMSQTDAQASLSTPVNQTDSQSQGRPGRRSKVSEFSEEMSQTDAQASLSAPVSQTDSQSQGRPGRRSKVSEFSEEMSQTDAQESLSAPVSQTDGQSQGRASRSKASEPSEAMGPTGAQANFSTPVSRTDGQSQGRPGRRSKASALTEAMNQTDTQASLSTPVSQTDSQSQGRPRRRSKASEPIEEISQTDKQAGLPTSASQTNLQPRGRPGRRSKASDPSEEEMSQTDTQASLSTPVRPTRRSKISEASQEMSQTEAQMTLSTPVSQTDGQLPGRSSRRSKASGSGEEMIQTESQTSLSAPVNQADAQSQRRSGRSKMAGNAADMSQTDSQTGSTAPPSQNDNALESKESSDGKETDPTDGNSRTDIQTALSAPASQTEEISQTDAQVTFSNPVCQTDSELQGTPSKRSKIAAVSALQPEHSQLTEKGEGTQESSQNSGQDQMSRFSQDLTDTENSELDVSRACEDDQKPRRRGRKRKLLNSKAKPASTLKAQQVSKGSSQIVAKETSPEAVIEHCEPRQDSESKSMPVNTEVKALEPSEEKENTRLTDMVPDGADNPLVESMAELKSPSVVLADVNSETQEDLLKPALEHSIEIGVLTDSRQKVRSRRGRGRPRSRGSNSRAAAMRERLSQESGISSSQVTDSQDLGEIVSPDPEPSSDSAATCPQPEIELVQQQNDAGVNDDVFLEPDAMSTPTISECLPAATPGEDEATTGSATAEEAWNTCVSEVQTGIDISEQAEDMEEGQRLDIDEPQVADTTECTVDPDKEQGGGEHSVEQEQGINRVEELDSVQEENAVKEVVSEVEGNAAQMDSDIPIAAADVTAIPTLPEEPPAPQEVMAEPPCLDSPPKQKLLDAVVGETGQSPGSGKTKGVWSPSASPSTSILKKGQKRPLEIESPSPLPKSRRVSFADPIQHQELADDIDRRSPVIRPSSAGSSPRSKNMVTISSQQKFITTPTKGLLTLSPRNLRSPGYKSSKKCLISEMTHEPKPIPKDCVYPALVSCSTPVEAVLPQISSNMWPRGFGQLVRARNIRTVGDLSALTPAEIKSLPIRSPKLSNVKKALRNYYEQQRKGRSDELKAFDEMEKMTSESDETEMAQQQEEGTQPGEQVPDAELADVPAPASAPAPTPAPTEERRPVELVSVVESLGARLTQGELSQCSPGQLVLMHEQLGGMMRAIVVQLQTRLSPTPGENIP